MSGRPNNYNHAEYRRTYSAIVGTLGSVQGNVSGPVLQRIHALMRMSFMLGHLYTLLEQEAFNVETLG